MTVSRRVIYLVTGEHAQRGELVRVLPHITTPAADIYALLEDDGHVPRRVAKLIDHLADRLPGRLERSA